MRRWMKYTFVQMKIYFLLFNNKVWMKFRRVDSIYPIHHTISIASLVSVHRCRSWNVTFSDICWPKSYRYLPWLFPFWAFQFDVSPCKLCRVRVVVSALSSVHLFVGCALPILLSVAIAAVLWIGLLSQPQPQRMMAALHRIQQLPSSLLIRLSNLVWHRPWAPFSAAVFLCVLSSYSCIVDYSPAISSDASFWGYALHDLQRWMTQLGAGIERFATRIKIKSYTRSAVMMTTYVIFPKCNWIIVHPSQTEQSFIVCFKWDKSIAFRLALRVTQWRFVLSHYSTFLRLEWMRTQIRISLCWQTRECSAQLTFNLVTFSTIFRNLTSSYVGGMLWTVSLSFDTNRFKSFNNWFLLCSRKSRFDISDCETPSAAGVPAKMSPSFAK